MNEGQSTPPSARIIYAVFDFFGRQYRKVIAGLIIVCVLAFLANGFYVVQKEEQAVRTRFGKVVDAEVGPGLGYAVPLIERAHVRKVKEIVGYQIGSRSGATINFTILSGDLNLLDTDVAVQYKIKNLRSYLFAASDPRKMLTMLVREGLVKILGENFIDLIFTSNRDVIQKQLAGLVNKRLESLGVGIELVTLNIVEVRSIPETLQAFRDVNDAFAEREQVVSRANSQREMLLARSKGQADALIMNAKANARERLVQARGSVRAFKALLAEYRKNPNQVAITRYWQRMRAIFTEASLAMVNPGKDSTIDINMLEGAPGFTPAGAGGHGVADLVTRMPHTAGDADGRLSRATMPPYIHRLETTRRDDPLREGRFHKRRTERDHARVASPRSLIFDTPSIFSHRHGAPGRKRIGNRADQRPMTEKMLGAGGNNHGRETGKKDD